jgi:hypothetical protein
VEAPFRTHKVVLPALLALLAAGSCKTQSSQPTPATQATTGRGGGAKVVDQLLLRCHNTLRGTMDNSFLELTKAGAKDTDKVVLGMGPDRRPAYLRITHANGSTSILNGKHAGHYVRVRGADGLYERTEFTGKEQKRLRDLNALLRAALLRPLYEARRVDRQGPNVYRLMLRGGETWRLEVDPKANLPKSLTGPPGKVSFDEHKATGVTYLPKVVTLGALGRHHLNLVDSDYAFNNTYFQDPETPFQRLKEIRKVGAFTAEPRKPTLQRVAGRLSLLLDDPGNWEERFGLLNKHARDLYRQGQASADLTFFYEEKGKRYMAIPFEPDIDRGSQAFLRKKGQRIFRRPPQLVAVVVPPRGSEEAVVKAGRKMLTEFLVKKDLRAKGPLRVIPYVDPGDPAAGERLEKLKIRLELPVGEK